LEVFIKELKIIFFFKMALIQRRDGNGKSYKSISEPENREDWNKHEVIYG